MDVDVLCGSRGRAGELRLARQSIKPLFVGTFVISCTLN
jgi:hypothetical protein